MAAHLKAPNSGIQRRLIGGVVLWLAILFFQGRVYSQSATAPGAASENRTPRPSSLAGGGAVPIPPVESLAIESWDIYKVQQVAPRFFRPRQDSSSGFRWRFSAPRSFVALLGPSDTQPWASEAVSSVGHWPQKETNPRPSQKKKKVYSPSADSDSPGHIFWVIPAFKVDYGKGFQPLTPKEKFKEWAQSSYDPLGLAGSVVEAATLEHSSKDGFCGYGKGWGGYGECFGSLELDSNVSSFIGDFALAVLLRQDPRYFRLGKGSFGKRVSYAVSRVFVTHSDSGRMVFYSSALAGTAIAAGLSNLYYPIQDRGVGHSMSRIGLDLGNTALYNLAAEFWPDFHRWLRRVF